MSSPATNIVRKTEATPEAHALLEEYYAAIGVQHRDTPEALAETLRDPASALWIAYVDGQPAGCVLLRPLPAIAAAAECKRLYVRPAYRGLRLADALMDALEAHAASEGFTSVYLDSKDDLTTAIALYRRRGYQPCDRYNDNPQATIFLRKPLGS